MATTTPSSAFHGEFLDAVIEGAIDCIIIIDAHGTVLRFNKAASELFGYTPEEIIGRNVNMLMPEPHISHHEEYIRRYLDTGKAAVIGIGREVEGVRNNGTRIPVRLAVSEVKINGEHFFTGVLHDLTAIKEREREVLELTQELEQKVKERTDELQNAINQLLKTNKKLEHEIAERSAMEAALRRSQNDLKESLEKEKELSDLKSRFVSTASHEFRTPLSTILSSAALVGRYTLTEQQDQREKHVSRIKSAVGTLNTILNDFLSLSKLEQGKVTLKPEVVQIGDFIHATVDEMDGLLKKDQQILVHDDTAGLRMMTDPAVLKNILYNLLSNSIKYSGPGDITCHARHYGAALVIDIVDQGIGVPVSEQKHLFERFFRAYNSTNIQGTGLGLYIVNNYINLLDGTIDFQSEEGKGSTFTVTLPIDESQ